MKVVGHAILLQSSDSGWAPLPVEVVWLTAPADWSFVSAWRAASRRGGNPALRDSLEYAALAGKRWRYLAGQDFAPDSPSALRHSIRQQPRGEFGLALALREKSAGAGILGFAFARRTWANNLMVEFLAGPQPAGNRIKGTGAALMQALALIGITLRCGELWGECTEASQGFYRTLKARLRPVSPDEQSPEAIRDRFQFTTRELRALLEPNRVQIKGCTAPPEKASSPHETS